MTNDDITKLGKVFILKYMDYFKGKITIFKNLNSGKNITLIIETKNNLDYYNNLDHELKSISCLCGKKYNIDMIKGFRVMRRKLSLMSKHLEKCQSVKGLYGSDIELSINEFMPNNKSNRENFGRFK